MIENIHKSHPRLILGFLALCFFLIVMCTGHCMCGGECEGNESLKTILVNAAV